MRFEGRSVDMTVVATCIGWCGSEGEVRKMEVACLKGIVVRMRLEDGGEERNGLRECGLFFIRIFY